MSLPKGILECSAQEPDVFVVASADLRVYRCASVTTPVSAARLVSQIKARSYEWLHVGVIEDGRIEVNHGAGGGA
jgi:hypothetical protein